MDKFKKFLFIRGDLIQKTLIVYESEYGTTKKIAKYLALVLGPAKYCTTLEFKDDYKDFDFFVIGSPLYSGKLLPKITEFIEENKNWLKNKTVSLFSTSISLEEGNEKLVELEKILGKVKSKKALGGKLIIKNLKKEDSKALKEFSKIIGYEIGDVNNFNAEDVIDYALELKKIKDELIPKIPVNELKKAIIEFLIDHNTCTLSTSHNERVRSTPIEYNYKDEHIYLISEGGEKFANILLNKNVSLAIYEDYTSMNNLAGMQITGIASIIEDEAEYKEILEMRNLNLKFINNIPFNMNVIKIKIQKVEFLYSEFQKRGYESKQIVIYE